MKPIVIADNTKANVDLWRTSNAVGQTQAITQICKKYHLARISANPDQRVPDAFDYIRDWLQENNVTEVSTPSYQNLFVMITINGRPDLTKEEVWAFVKTLEQLTKVWIHRWIACVEYNTKNGCHPHIHMLVEKQQGYYDKPKSQIIKEMYSTFKAFVGNPEQIDVKFKQYPHEALEYVKGNKHDETKMPYVQHDVKWREINGIPAILGNWGPTEERTRPNGPPVIPVFATTASSQQLVKSEESQYVNGECQLCGEQEDNCWCSASMGDSTTEDSVSAE